MACKTKKKLKLRKYIKGGDLPKYKTAGYLDEASNMFTPQVNDPTLNVGNNKMSTVDYNTGQVNVTGGNPNKSTGSNLGSYMGYAGAAGSAIGAVSDGDITGAETQNIVDQVGSNFAFYSVGKTVDEAIFQKDDQGLYKNDLQASLSYGLTDPAQQLSQSVEDFNQGEYGQALFESLLPGLAGIEYQSDQEKEVAEQERKQRNKEMNAINENKLNQLNANTISYMPTAKYGGKLRRFANGGGLEDPLKPTGYSPIPIQKYDYEITPATIYNVNPRPLTSEQSRLLALEKGYSNIDENILREIAVKDSNYRYDPKVLDSTGKPTLQTVNRSNPIPSVSNKKIPYTEDGLNGLNSLGLDMKKSGGSLNQDKRLVKRPVIRKYTGQTHEGKDGGIPVDSNGNPTSMTGNQPVGLTEKGEVSYNGYIFSEYLKRNKKK